MAGTLIDRTRQAARRHRRALTGAALAAGLLSLMASSCDSRGLGDAPLGRRHEAPRQVFVNPDSFPNLVATCVGDNLVISSTKYNPTVVPHDPTCQEGGRFFTNGE